MKNPILISARFVTARLAARDTPVPAGPLSATGNTGRSRGLGTILQLAGRP